MKGRDAMVGMEVVFWLEMGGEMDGEGGKAVGEYGGFQMARGVLTQLWLHVT